MSLIDTIFSNLFGEYGGDLAIDLGTANTLVAVRGQGIVINEPSVVAIDKSESRVLAVGADAKRMIGRTPGSIIAERPLKDGVIADFDVTEVMLRYFIEKARERRYPWSPRPRVVVCVPSGVTSVEKRAVFEATIQAGARQMRQTIISPIVIVWRNCCACGRFKHVQIDICRVAFIPGEHHAEVEAIEGYDNGNEIGGEVLTCVIDDLQLNGVRPRIDRKFRRKIP